MEQLIKLLNEMQMPSDKVLTLKKAFKSNDKLAIRVSLSWFSQHLNKFNREGQIDTALTYIESIMKGKK